MVGASLERRLSQSLQDMWKDRKRSKTLARIAFQRRQFENWWKFEVATHLWELAAEEGVDVFIESLKRADVVLARQKMSGGRVSPDTDHSLCVPIELKTVGTWWGAANIKKAYGETGKKRLAADMDTASRGERPAKPFAIVALLLTHEPALGPAIFRAYIDAACALGSTYGLTEVINQRLVLPTQSEGTPEAQQLLWIART